MNSTHTATVQLARETFESDSIEEVAAFHDVEVTSLHGGAVVQVAGSVEEVFAYLAHFPALDS